ncbi:MAG: hypothetical protein U0636_00405 [Phycisphaerales bacterium]
MTATESDAGAGRAAAGPGADTAATHRRLAAQCFNDAWRLMEKAPRTPQEDLLMFETCMASIYHWRNSPDCTAKNLSVGYWQASRIAAMLGWSAEAVRFAELCSQSSTGLTSFYAGYAAEAACRAALCSEDAAAAARHLAAAEQLCGAVGDAKDRALLAGDLQQLRAQVEARGAS